MTQMPSPHGRSPSVAVGVFAEQGSQGLGLRRGAHRIHHADRSVEDPPEGGFNCAVVPEKSMRMTDSMDKVKPVVPTSHPDTVSCLLRE